MYYKFIFTIRLKLFLIFALTNILFAQSGTYYNSLNPSTPTFISDLETRIRAPYSQISYNSFDETNIANFASIDNSNMIFIIRCCDSK